MAQMLGRLFDLSDTKDITDCSSLEV